MFDKVTLIGIGLIGSSLSHVMRREGLAKEISVSSRSQETLDRAKELNLGDHYHLDAAEAVKDADLVIVCTPVGACEAVAKTIAPALKKGAIVTDVGSVKASVIKQMKPHLPDTVHFVPGHPIAGTEYSGPDSGFASLFEGRWCVLTPEEGTDDAAVSSLTKFWETCGSNVETMEANHHDLVLAITSHLPHFIAYNIVGTADDLATDIKSEVIKFSASGFRDFTRLAASDPTMWRDVALHNKDAILETLGRFSEDLSDLQRAIRRDDGDKLFDMFTRTRGIRRSVIEMGQDVAAPNFGRDGEGDEPAS